MKMKVAKMPPTTCGSAILKNDAKAEQPSIRADSSGSRGIASKNPFIIHTSDMHVGAIRDINGGSAIVGGWKD
jgi:hypothetical protein